MIHHLLYTEESAHLTESWLHRKKPAPDSAVLVCDSDSMLEQARALCARHPAVKEAVLLTEAQPGGDARIVLPLALGTTLMRHPYRVHVPYTPPHYPMFHRLWLCGFRHFDVYSPQGERSYHIPHLLDAFQNRHTGQRCFVVGNGPSLNAIDMPRLKGEITLGANRAYLGYEKWGFPFTYWGVYDKYQIETHYAEYEENIPEDTVKFFPFEYLPYLEFPNACPVNVFWSRNAAHKFSANPGKLYVGYTVSYMMLQVAAVMGCNPIYLIGMDHRYELRHPFYSDTFRRTARWGVRQLRKAGLYEPLFAAHEARLAQKSPEAWRREKKVWSAHDAQQPTHFDPRYTAAGARKFAPPEPAEAERDFACAEKWARENGVKILNATPGSALDAFEKVEFDGLF